MMLQVVKREVENREIEGERGRVQEEQEKDGTSQKTDWVQ